MSRIVLAWEAKTERSRSAWVKPRHYPVFELRVAAYAGASPVARELKTDPASVDLIGSRLTRQLKAEVAKLREQLG